MWGFITVMNDVLNNTFISMFNLSKTKAALVQFSFFTAYFFVSLFYFIYSNKYKDPINKIGYKNAMILGLSIAGLGCFLFYPASLIKSYYFFLIALFILSSGITILQIAANPFIAIIGPDSTAGMRLNLAQGFNSLGTTLGPIAGTFFIFYIFSDGLKSPESVGKTYLLYGVIFFILAFILKKSQLPDYKSESQTTQQTSIFQYRQLTLGIIAIFCYVGAEVSIGNWIGKYIQEVHIGNIKEESANKFLAYFWGGLMIGRICGAVSMSKIKHKNLLNLVLTFSIFFLIFFLTAINYSNGTFELRFQNLEDIRTYLIILPGFYILLLLTGGNPSRSIALFSFVSIGLIVVSILSEGYIAMWSIMSVGLFCSIMWSNIFTLSIKGLGNQTSKASSLLIMAIVGGAIFPLVQGYVADLYTIQNSFIVPVIGFIYLVFYGINGYKPKYVSQ